MKQIDVIIPVYKPDKTFRELLEKLNNQTYPVRKVILMNTGDVTFDRSYLAIHPGTEVHRVEKEAFDHGGTRHEGAMLSDADYLLFMTQDAMPEDDHLTEEMVQMFSQYEGTEKEPGVVYARQLPAENCHVLEKYTRAFNYPDQSRVKTKADIPELGIKTFFCSDVCAMYNREVYIRQGGFIRHTIFNEDMIFAGNLIQAGGCVGYAAKARVIHSHNYSGLQQFHRNFDLAVSQADHPEVFAAVKSESEGIRMVKSSAKYCLKIGRPWLIVKLVWQSGWKFLGYKLGKMYRKLPKAVVRFCTTNPRYFA